MGFSKVYIFWTQVYPWTSTWHCLVCCQVRVELKEQASTFLTCHFFDDQVEHDWVEDVQVKGSEVEEDLGKTETHEVTIVDVGA